MGQLDRTHKTVLSVRKTRTSGKGHRDHAAHVSDADMVLMARDIAKKIEDEMEYPGQIKVNIIRESRATEYAK